EDSGVLTIARPNSRQAFYGALKLLTAVSAKLAKMEKKNRSLIEKMTDIRTVNRAKWLLIENLNMTENDAHHYIEKQAMDTRLSRREVAEGIIRTYDK
ncbi:MAG: ANTAR domain-containing protein, partial [Treponema sp.]|nr:ANTAR domain-containing protein [Treponema sp.]MDY5837264.1 ANTAR domain-containing protein [Treponema sp.]